MGVKMAMWAWACMGMYSRRGVLGTWSLRKISRNRDVVEQAWIGRDLGLDLGWIGNIRK